MPLYEFACNACGAQLTVFVRAISSPVNANCDRCGSADLRKLVSRFAVLKPAGGLDSLDSGVMDGLDENDPRAMASWARRMQQESGEDMGPEFDEMIDRMERGEMPDADFSAGDDDSGYDGLE